MLYMLGLHIYNQCCIANCKQLYETCIYTFSPTSDIESANQVVGGGDTVFPVKLLMAA